MPDPRLVSRAQRAATMLERAWERWRSAHGLAAEPLPPVSSYVGYSIEEPWGRPRVVFGVAAEDAERLAAFLEDSLHGADEADDDGPWPAAVAGPAGPAGAERGNLLEDVRGRIPVQGWPEFSESREQLNSSGATGPAGTRPGIDGAWPPGTRAGQAAAAPGEAAPGQAAPGQARPGQAGPGQAGPGQAGPAEVPPGAVAPGLADVPHGDNGLAAVGGPAGADGPHDGGRPGGVRGDGGPASRSGNGVAEDDLRYDDDDAEHAAWLTGIGANGEADDDDEYCDTADDLRATPHGARPAQATAPGPDAADRTSHNGASGRHDTEDGGTEPGGPPVAGAGPANTGVIGWPSSAGLTHAPRPPASQPPDDRPPASGDPADGQPTSGPVPGRADESQPGGPQPGRPDTQASGANGRPSDGPVDRPQDGPAAAAADVPADLGSRTSLTDTMAAELAGWAAGELPGQASARLAAWASVGGAVARGRRQARQAGGSTAAERVR